MRKLTRIVPAAVIAVFLLSLSSCRHFVPDDNPDNTAPTPGAGLSFSSVQATWVTVSWDAAADDVTSAAQLLYKLVRSSADNMDSVENAEANGTTVMSWRKGALQFSVNGLESSATYYFALLVKDGAGNEALYPQGSVTTAGHPGVPDPSFNGTGTSEEDFGPGYDFAKGVGVQSDGKVIVAGNANGHISLVRYNLDGSRDGSFGTDGKLILNFDLDNASVMGMAIQADNSIVLAGAAMIDNAWQFLVVRLTPDGELDPAFSDDGIVTTAVGTDSEAWSVAVAPDGRIVVAGESDGEYAVARYNTDGSLDQSFGGDGKVTTQIGTLSGGAKSVAIAPDGRIAAGGYVFRGPEHGGYQIALVCYTSSGVPVEGFGTDGVVSTDISGFDDEVYGIAFEPDGRIVAAGFTWDGSDAFSLALLCYERNGELDPDFGVDGKVIMSIGSSFTTGADVAVQTDGSIIVLGETGLDTYVMFLARFDSSGNPDEDFGTDGVATILVGTLYTEPDCMAVAPDGRIVAAGYCGSGTNADFAVACYLQ